MLGSHLFRRARTGRERDQTERCDRNHDTAEQLKAGLSGPPFVHDFAHRHDGWLVVMLDSTVAGFNHGHLETAEQQNWLANAVVASNKPWKIALAHLNDGGRLWMVTVTGLRRFIARASEEVFGNYEKVKQGPHYTVAVARKAA